MNGHNGDGRLTRREAVGGALAAAAPLFLPNSARASARRYAANERLHVACIGLGNQMQGHLREITANLGHDIIAVCDVDSGRVAESAKTIPEVMPKANVYKDYRKLLETEKSLDAVIIATPDHWHATICTAAIRAGKHVYCEKPLTHTHVEARALRELSRRSRVVTQTGNQGSASGNMRRCIELIEAGLFGQIHEIHVWHPKHGWPSGVARPDGEDPIPEGLDWDFWLGPAPARPYKSGQYHPVKWRGWYDFGGGSVADFCCHAFNLPVRALKLEYPTHIEPSGVDMGYESFPTSCTVRYRFPARKSLDAVNLNFYTGGELPPPEATADLKATYDSVPELGCLLIGEKGSVSAGLWNTDGMMKLNDEKTFRSVNDHEAAKSVPVTLPRTEGHMKEWVDAIKGGAPAFSPFEIGGHLTEIGLTGVLALRLGHEIDWDGRAMRVRGSREADAIIRPELRRGWR